MFKKINFLKNNNNNLFVIFRLKKIPNCLIFDQQCKGNKKFRCFVLFVIAVDKEGPHPLHNIYRTDYEYTVNYESI